MNYLCFFILSLISTIYAQTSTTENDNVDDQSYEVCLYLNSISIDDPNPAPLLNDIAADSKAIVYAYNKLASEETFQSLQFPIITKQTEAEIEDDIHKAVEEGVSFVLSLPETDPKVGCWVTPSFNDLELRFKVYQYYHIALKAVSSVLIPAISNGPATQMISLQTLEGEMRDLKVEVELTLSWNTHHVELSAPITPLKPIDSPFDSDEMTNAIVAVDDEEPVFEDENAVVPVDVVVPVDTASKSMGQQVDEQSTDWMLVAASISAALGGIILCYICIRAYKRMGYEPISYPSKCSKLKSIRRISLRNIEVDEESKNIMHPSASYTF